MTTDPRPYGKRPLTDIAAAICEHLQRIERDSLSMISVHKPSAERAGARIFVEYDWCDGAESLARPAAVRYLAWLDAGNIGTHRDIPEDFEI